MGEMPCQKVKFFHFSRKLKMSKAWRIGTHLKKYVHALLEVCTYEFSKMKNSLKHFVQASSKRSNARSCLTFRNVLSAALNTLVNLTKLSIASKKYTGRHQDKIRG